MDAVNGLPAGSKTLLLYETRSLYCRPDCFPDEILDRWKREWSIHHDEQAILDSWKAQGFSHILFYRLGAQFNRESGDPHNTAEEWQALDRFLAKLPEPVSLEGVYELYRLPE